MAPARPTSLPGQPQDRETPIMAQYKAIKREHPHCLVFFRLGDFYELFFEDAKIASGLLDIVLTARDKNGPHPIPMCGVPVHASENYIARLIKKGHHVALCEQVEKTQDKVGKGLVKREVVRIITTGTLVEEGLLESRRHNFLMAITQEEQGDNLAVASVDISTGDFFLESCGSHELAALLTRLDAKEILLPESMIQDPRHKALWAEWKTRITLLPPSKWDKRTGEERLLGFFRVHSLQGFGAFTPEEMAAAGTVLDYVLLTHKRHLLGISPPQKLEKQRFMAMDAFTRRSLEVVQTFSGERKGSLLHFLDHTLTPMGGRLFYLRLTHPLRHGPSLQERLDSVDFFVQNKTHRLGVRALLEGLPDMERAMGRLVSRRGSPRDMLAIMTTLVSLRHLVPFLCQAPAELQHLEPALEAAAPITQLLQRALNPQAPAALRDGDVIASGYHGTLDEYRTLKTQEESIIKTLEKKYIEDTGITTLKIRYNSIIGYYIEVSQQASSKMPFQFILRQSLVSSCRYVTPELMDIEQRLRHASQRTLHLEEELFEQLIEAVEKNHGTLRRTVQALAVLDVSAALAHMAQTHNYVRPELKDTQEFSITQGRHAVVEQVHTHHQKRAFVANDCILNPHKVWVITGPNMAGKSTFLRQNALMVLLAHIGSFVPAEKAVMGLVDRLFSRVGASDDLARGHSTFMVEMMETAAILNQATSRSFVILDEVGRGTSTYDGLSLAWACTEYIVNTLQCRTLFATHYHELQALKNLPTLGLYTLGITHWGQDLVFLYQITSGTSAGSYGLHVAKLAGMPETVLTRANTLLQALETQGHSLPLQLPSPGTKEAS